MRLHADALALLSDWPAPSPEQEELRLRYLAHLEQHPDGALRSCTPDHLTASTLVLSTGHGAQRGAEQGADGAQVLLTLHAKARRWFQFGGHIEPYDISLLDAATREAREESGLDLTLDPVPVQLSEHAVPFCGPAGSSGDVHHLDVRFLAIVGPDVVHAVSEESLDVAWWPADALPDPDQDLVDLVRLARRRLELGGG